MLVRELIAHLSELDQDLPVIMPADDGSEFSNVETALIETFVAKRETLFLADERDAGHYYAIRLVGPEADHRKLHAPDD